MVRFGLFPCSGFQLDNPVLSVSCEIHSKVFLSVFASSVSFCWPRLRFLLVFAFVWEARVQDQLNPSARATSHLSSAIHACKKMSPFSCVYSLQTEDTLSVPFPKLNELSDWEVAQLHGDCLSELDNILFVTAVQNKPLNSQTPLAIAGECISSVFLSGHLLMDVNNILPSGAIVLVDPTCLSPTFFITASWTEQTAYTVLLHDLQKRSNLQRLITSDYLLP